jgi:hypothetical protein
VIGRIRTTRFPRLDALAAFALFACSSAAALAAPPVHVGTLAPAQPNQEERFGFAVDVRGDLAVVGAYGDSLEGQLFRGSASVYRLGNDGVWEFEQRLVAADGAAFDQFGFAVAIVDEGAARGIVVTAPKGAGAQHPDQGCAYAYELVGGVWTLSSKLTLAVGANNDAFGYSADGSADAVAIGAVFDDATATNQGSASVFRRTGSGAQASWALEATLVAPDAALNDQFGFDVALDGRTLLVGANSDDIAGVVDGGSAWVFRRDAGAWTAEAQLRAANGTAGDFFGTSVALAEPVDTAGAIGPEGGLALCGSIFDAPEGLVKRGSATLFRRTKGAWTERATLVAAESAAGDECGVSVALGSGGAPGASLALVDDFKLALVGGFKHDTAGAADAGRVWGWSTDATGTALPAWSLTAPTACTGDAFGHAIALDSATLAVGAYATDGAAPNQGALHLDAIAPAPCPGDLDGNGIVDSADLGARLSAWGTPAADLDGNGDTGASDLAAMLNAWGACGG